MTSARAPTTNLELQHALLNHCVVLPAMLLHDREIYDKLSPGFKGRCTAPLLIDKKTMQPVSNESSSIVRMLGQVQLPGCFGVDLYPQDLRQDIDQLNDQVTRCCVLHAMLPSLFERLPCRAYMPLCPRCNRHHACVIMCQFEQVLWPIPQQVLIDVADSMWVDQSTNGCNIHTCLCDDVPM